MGRLSLREYGLRGLLFAASLLVCALIVEIFLRSFPHYLPADYRAAFPMNGLGLLQPGILERTPIDAVPLPYYTSHPITQTLPVPQDLKDRGLVARNHNADQERYPKVVFSTDRYGLANSAVPERADILIVGDSFAYAAGMRVPLGLIARLQQQIPETIYNLGVPAIGPQREFYMLTNIGLPLRPKGVIWLFFGGNDIDDAASLARHQADGIRYYGDFTRDFSYPDSYFIDLVGKALAPKNMNAERTGPAPLSPFIYDQGGAHEQLWFHPAYLRNLGQDQHYWQQHIGWHATREVLSSAHAALNGAGISLLLVYMPSKAQAYLPYVARDPQLLHRMASFDLAEPLITPPDQLWESTLKNHGSQEAVVAAFAASEGIDYLSLTPAMEQAAQEGLLGYLAADTHWNDIGQRVAVEPILDWIRTQGVSRLEP